MNGMAEVLARHSGHTVMMPLSDDGPFRLVCNGCRHIRPILNHVGQVRTPEQWHFMHVAEELAKAGYRKARSAA